MLFLVFLMIVSEQPRFFSCRGTCTYGVECKRALHKLKWSTVLGGYESVSVRELGVRDSIERVHPSRVVSALFLSSLMWKPLL